jgi:hypothetical protein
MPVQVPGDAVTLDVKVKERNVVVPVGARQVGVRIAACGVP